MSAAVGRLRRTPLAQTSATTLAMSCMRSTTRRPTAAMVRVYFCWGFGSREIGGFTGPLSWNLIGGATLINNFWFFLVVSRACYGATSYFARVPRLYTVEWRTYLTASWVDANLSMWTLQVANPSQVVSENGTTYMLDSTTFSGPIHWME
jgi:hypothetical protein